MSASTDVLVEALRQVALDASGIARELLERENRADIATDAELELAEALMRAFVNYAARIKFG